MPSFVAFIAIYFIINISKAWQSMGAGGMSGVTYASGTIYNINTMCPNNVNQGYACDGRNFGDKYLNPDTVSAFCSGYSTFGTSSQYGFGHGVTETQACGECAQIRVPRLDGTYNYMTVMMVDHFTWSMEVGTTEIAKLVEGTRWVVGDRADFDWRLVDDCYASFGDDVSTPSTSSTSSTTSTTSTTSSTSSNGGGSSGGGSGSGCSITSNWGDMTISPYWGSTTSQMFANVYNPPTAITSFAIKGYGDSNYQDCVLQNADFWQCVPSHALTEPASVRLNGGQFYGINIIESMTGSTARYGRSGCSISSAYTEEDGAGGMSWTSVFAIIISCLIGIGLIVTGGICLYNHNKKKKGVASFEDGVDGNIDNDTANTGDNDVGEDNDNAADTNIEVVA